MRCRWCHTPRINGEATEMRKSTSECTSAVPLDKEPSSQIARVPGSLMRLATTDSVTVHWRVNRVRRSSSILSKRKDRDPLDVRMLHDFRSMMTNSAPASGKKGGDTFSPVRRGTTGAETGLTLGDRHPDCVCLRSGVRRVVGVPRFGRPSHTPKLSAPLRRSFGLGFRR